MSAQFVLYLFIALILVHAVGGIVSGNLLYAVWRIERRSTESGFWFVVAMDLALVAVVALFLFASWILPVLGTIFMYIAGATMVALRYGTRTDGKFNS